MKKFLLIYCFFINISCQSQTDVFHQEWIGYITLSGHTQHARISAKADTITLRLRDEGPEGKYTMKNIKEEDEKFYFEVERRKGKWAFSGQLKEENILEGHLQAGDLMGQFLLFKSITSKKEAWQPCLGNYQLPGGKHLIIKQTREYLRLHSGINEQYTGLKKIGENRYLSSSLEILQFDDLQNGVFQTVEWQSSDGQKLTAARVPSYRVEDHLIITSTDTIGASLYLPNSAGKHPGCIIPIGAARYDRSISDLEAEFFATYGIATLIYDNHGYGKSTGNLLEKSFVDKQQVAIELFRWLQKHPDIDVQKVGFRGASQGGRIASMAASTLPETAFVILVATPMETRMDQQLYAFAHYHRQQNIAEEAIAHSTDLWRQFFINAEGEIVDTAFVEALQTFRNIHPNMELPRATLDGPPYYPWKDDILNNTSSYLPTVQCPVLCMFGALDGLVPPQKSIHLLRTGMENAGQKPPTVITYEGVGHSFTLPGFRIIPGFFMDQIRFMQKVLELD